MGTCPKCGKIVMHANLGDVTVGQILGQQWHGIKYCCPFCQCILGISIDPVALKTDIVSEILRAFGKHP